MTQRRLQIFFLVFGFHLLGSHLHADPVVGQIYPFSMIDVDGNKVSQADGRITMIVVASSTDTGKARAVGDLTPDHCLGNPEFRMITLLRFKKKHMSVTQTIMKAAVRRRLAAEAQALQARYQANNIARNARADVICVADFDETAGSQFGIPSGSTKFEVLVLGRKGDLLRIWDTVPTAEELAGVLK